MAKKRKQSKGRERIRRLLLIGGGVALAAVVITAGLLAFRGGGESSQRRAIRPTPVVTDAMQVDVDVIDNDYDPKVLQVRLGTTITWIFVGDLPHTVTDDNGTFDSGTLQQGAVYEHMFATAGTYSYYCTIHHAMTGRVTVSP